MVQLKSYQYVLLRCTHAADFRLSSAPYVLFDNSSCCSQPVPYSIRDDSIAEPDEIFTIKISMSLISAHIQTVYAIPSVNVTIIDNDGRSDYVDFKKLALTMYFNSCKNWF